jgi:hypothetical protein
MSSTKEKKAKETYISPKLQSKTLLPDNHKKQEFQYISYNISEVIKWKERTTKRLLKLQNPPTVTVVKPAVAKIISKLTRSATASIYKTLVVLSTTTRISVVHTIKVNAISLNDTTSSIKNINVAKKIDTRTKSPRSSAPKTNSTMTKQKISKARKKFIASASSHSAIKEKVTEKRKAKALLALSLLFKNTDGTNGKAL